MNFGHVYWMDESLLFNKIKPTWKYLSTTRVGNCNIAAKKWHLQDLRRTLSDYIIYKISLVPIPDNNIDDKIA